MQHYKNYSSLEACVLGFCELCRGHELSIGLNHSEEALMAAQSGFINDSKSFKIALRSIFCSCEEEYFTFDRCFDIYWRKKRHEYMPKTRTRKQTKIIKQTKESVVLVGSGDDEETKKDGARTVSGANKMESLRKTDFSKVSDIDHLLMDELAEKLLLQLNHRLKRRLKASKDGKIDFRKTIRRNLSQGDNFFELSKKNRKFEKYRMIILLDVSGSMDKYSFYLLKFIWTLKSNFKNIEAFVFSTKLLRITEFIEKVQIDHAMLQMNANSVHWSSGTVIGKCLQEFNDQYSKMVLNGRSITIILSDGLDTGEPELLSEELKKIKLRTSKVIWLNPLKGMEGYEPLAKGMKAALPEIHTFESAHNLESLMELEKYLSHV